MALYYTYGIMILSLIFRLSPCHAPYYKRQKVRQRVGMRLHNAYIQYYLVEELPLRVWISKA